MSRSDTVRREQDVAFDCSLLLDYGRPQPCKCPSAGRWAAGGINFQADIWCYSGESFSTELVKPPIDCNFNAPSKCS